MSRWHTDFEKRTIVTLQWIEQSIIATGYRGSAAYYQIGRSWSAAYPETTGYIIETLLDYSSYLKEDKWKDLAMNCADWLCDIQREDGAFSGGLGEQGEPVIFDTGQILFGLVAVFKITGEKKYAIAIEKAVEWLIASLEEDGSWKRFAYLPGYVPSYYTRVVWAVLHANQFLQNADYELKMKKALDFYGAKLTSNSAVSDWSFRPDEYAYTHTIAYTMRGFLESGAILQQNQWVEIAATIADQILFVYQKHKKLAGSYDMNWKGDYSFVCVTGNAQLSLVMSRLYRITNKRKYRTFAIQIFENTYRYQCLIPVKGWYGGVAGSAPIWGKYQRFRFINWAAKFYLDAYLQLMKIHEHNQMDL